MTIPMPQKDNIDKRFFTIGLLAVMNALALIPSILRKSLIKPFVLLTTDTGMRIVGIIVIIASLCLFSLVFSSSKRLLRSRFSFKKADALISVLIMLYTALSVLDFISLMTVNDVTAVFYYQITLMLLGIVYFVFGLSLLQLQGSLYGVKKPFLYVCMATGVSSTAILVNPFIFNPITLLILAVGNIMLGMIFMRASRAGIAGHMGAAT